MTDIARVAVLGCGYWGQNLVRNFHALHALDCVCDVSPEPLRQAAKAYGVRTSTDVGEVLQDGRIDAVVIAAPAVQHYDLAKRALLARKDVFVEKPLSLRSSEGRELVELARQQNRILMVGHILEHHPAVLELKKLIANGDLGKIEYIYSSRLNLGKLRTEENILWSFAPHDISAILYLLGETPVRASSHGGTYLNPPIVDTTLSTLDFASGAKAHVFVSWLHPFKEQKLTIVGSKMMAVFDDVQTKNKLVLYSHRINWHDRKPVAEKDGGQAVTLPSDEPLQLECEHFLDCVRTRQRPRTDGESGVRVLEVLEGCEQSLQTLGAPIELHARKRRFFAHETAVIDEPSEIGEGTKIWHFSHIMSRAKLGRDCNLGQNVVISPDVQLGNNVKIQNNVSVYTGVELEDGVFCGPSMVFTNVINPRSHINRHSEYQRTLVRRGATLGANSTIVCGVTIGRYAFVAAGSVVTHDIPDYGLVMGVPAKLVGWVCACGIRLGDDGSGIAPCPCGKRYSISEGVCHPLETEGNGVATERDAVDTASRKGV